MIAMTVGAHKIRLMAEKGLGTPIEDDVTKPAEKPQAECRT
jgi:hypothetical protein